MRGWNDGLIRGDGEGCVREWGCIEEGIVEWIEMCEGCVIEGLWRCDRGVIEGNGIGWKYWKYWEYAYVKVLCG